MTRILIVTPAFHGYGDSIGNALRRRGHEVFVHMYDRYASVLSKARHKLLVELPAQVGVDSRSVAVRRATAETLDVLEAVAPDLVIVIRGDLLGDRFWDSLDASRRPYYVWFYDELRRMPFGMANLARATGVVSYSQLDVAEMQRAGMPAHWLPNAFDRDLAITPGRTRVDEVSFIGARYPDREQAMLHLRDAGIPVRGYGRDWSGHPADRLRTWSWRRPRLPAERDVDRAAAYAVMARSAATLNMHANQDGFTMRTFEACGSSAVQLIDRTDLAGFYDDGVELASWSTLDELVELCQRARVDRVWSDGLREQGRRRTLAEHTFDHRVKVLEQLWA